MLSPSAYSKSENAAYKLLSDCKVKTAPVPILAIAQKLKIEVIHYNLGDDASGVLVIKNGFGTIGINPKNPITRQRFTIAHEIGHYVLHQKYNELFVDNYYLLKYRKNNSYSAEEYKHEQEANAFAAALLMPESLIQVEMASEDYGDLEELELIAQLASKFEVSVAAMSYRLANLNIYF